MTPPASGVDRATEAPRPRPPAVGVDRATEAPRHPPPRSE